MTSIDVQAGDESGVDSQYLKPILRIQMMSIGSILSWLICGLVVGMCARFFVPGRQFMSLPLTTALGISGALAGGFLYSVIRGAAMQPFSLSSHNWYGWIVAILGAMLLVWIYPYIYPRRWLS